MNSTMITCFIETARYGSFTKAADNLYFAQQTVSKHVAMLEKELRVSLFDRAGTGVCLTQVGSYYYNLFQSSVYNSNLVKANIDRYYAQLNSTIRIGCSEWLSPYGDIYVTIAGFRQQYEDIHLSLRIFHNNDLLENLLNEELDIALFSEAHLPNNRDFEAVPVCKEELCLVGPNSVIGDDLPPEKREQRRDMTLLIVPGWNRGYTETNVLCKQEILGLEIPVNNVLYVPNLASQCVAMEQMKYLAFSDMRFGFHNAIEGLGSELLGTDSSVYCCIPLQTENSGVYKLIDHMKNSLN